MNLGVTIALVIIGLLIGFMFGVGVGVDLVVKKVTHIIPLFANITVNEQLVNDALFSYENNINKCYALIYNNTRN